MHRLCSCTRHLLGARRRSAAWAAGPARRCTTTSCAASSPPTRPNELWLTDITEHRTDEGKLYLCAIKDVCSNRIVGYSIDARMKASLAVAALRNAIALRGRAGTRRALRPRQPIPLRRSSSGRCATHGLVGSMGRVGACADNAAMESFFSLLQKNVLDRQRWSHPRGAAPGDRRPGSNAPTTAGAANAASASSPRSSSRPSTRPLMRPEGTQPRESTEAGAVPLSHH